MSKVEYLHFLTEGAFIVNLARQMYWFEDKEEEALKLLTEGFVGMTENQAMKLISGNATITGYDICGKPECKQCKGLTQIEYTETQDADFKREIKKRSAWLAKNYFKSGQFHIPKESIYDYLVQKRLVEFLEKNGDISLGEERNNLQVIYNAFFHHYCLKPIKYDEIPEPTERSYKFALALQTLLKNYKPAPKEEERLYNEFKMRVSQCQVSYAAPKNETHLGIIAEQLGQTLVAIAPDDEDDHEKYQCEIPYDGIIINLGKFLVERRFVDDYANEVRFNRSSMMYAMYGRMEQGNLMHPLAKRIVKHRRIFESIGMIYHDDWKDSEKDTDDSIELSHLIDEYIEKKYPEISISSMVQQADHLKEIKDFTKDFVARQNIKTVKQENES